MSTWKNRLLCHTMRPNGGRCAQDAGEVHPPHSCVRRGSAQKREEGARLSLSRETPLESRAVAPQRQQRHSDIPSAPDPLHGQDASASPQAPLEHVVAHVHSSSIATNSPSIVTPRVDRRGGKQVLSS